MQEQDGVRMAAAVGAADMMAAWLASGGAVEALDERDAHAVCGRHCAGEGADDGMKVLVPTLTPNLCGLGGDDGLQAVVPSIQTSCGFVEDGLQANRASIHICGDDGLQAFGLTRGGIQAC